MAEYKILYKEGDKAFVEATISYAEIHNGKVYYHIREAKEIIPQEKLVPAPEPIDKGKTSVQILKQGLMPAT